MCDSSRSADKRLATLFVFIPFILFCTALFCLPTAVVFSRNNILRYSHADCEPGTAPYFTNHKYLNVDASIKKHNTVGAVTATCRKKELAAHIYLHIFQIFTHLPWNMHLYALHLCHTAVLDWRCKCRGKPGKPGQEENTIFYVVIFYSTVNTEI